MTKPATCRTTVFTYTRVFYFTANLKAYTLTDRRPQERFGAYLLSADYARPNLDLAEQVREQDRLLVADNGNVDLLREFAGRFRERAGVLDQERRAAEKELGHDARPGELPAALRKRFTSLARTIATASDERITETYAKEALTAQRSMQPDFLIGMEDLTLGTMAALNLEPEYCDLPTDFYAERADRAVTWATRSQSGDLAGGTAQVLAGLHALDFDGAALAGTRAANAGLGGIAVGLFGALTDRNHVDFRVEDGQQIALERRVPRPYLRVMELAAGLLEGYRRAGYSRPAFHALGAGTPILLPLLGLLSAGEPYFATDGTAPIVDGWSSPTISLYVRDPAPMKYRASKIAARWIEGGRGWDCQCLYCETFHEAHPPNLAAARRWWKREGQPKITKPLLERSGPLSAYLPFLGYCADDDLRREAALARVGHNHEALRSLQEEIRTCDDDPQKLIAWVGAIVTAYEAASKSKGWAAAVREAFTLGARVAANSAASPPS